MRTSRARRRSARAPSTPTSPSPSPAVYAAVRCLFSPELPNNAGYIRPIKVYAPEGTFVNPVHPAPVAARGLGGFRVMQDRVWSPGPAKTRTGSPHAGEVGSWE